MHREYHKAFSPSLNKDMELLVFGHQGARVIVFPTSMGRFFDWENRGMVHALREHIEKGWIQLFCLDSVDSESWYNKQAHPAERAQRHLQYQDYVVNEVLPFSRSGNENPFLIAAGCSFGAYHAVNIALRFPDRFNRVIGMSGVYDIRDWSEGYNDRAVFESNPVDFIRWVDDEDRIAKMRQLDMIIPIGGDDPAFASNKELSEALWSRGIWHAFRVWDGWAHDWPFWHEMVLHYISGPDSR